MTKEFGDFLSSIGVEENQGKSLEGSYRPALFVGVGGFGCAVVKKLKERIRAVSPSRLDGFGFIGLDAHQDDSAILTRNEYVSLSLGVTPHEVAANNLEYLDWYLKLTKSWKARNINAGADGVKAVGRFAFRNPTTVGAFISAVSGAGINLIKFREKAEVGVPPKVCIVSTLAGGTGAGCLLDVMFILGKLCRDQFGADFPYQAILVAPDVFVGRAGSPDKAHRQQANAYATLKELHHFICGNYEQTSYNPTVLKDTTIEKTLLPGTIHLISNKNERGNSVCEEIGSLQDIAVSWLLSDILTPLPHSKEGAAKIQDKENEISGNLDNFNSPKAFSSFGVVRTGIPSDFIEYFFSLRLAEHAIRQEFVSSPSVLDDVSNWLDTNKLKEAGVDQLQDKIRQEVGPDSLRFSPDARGNVLEGGFKREDFVKECRAYQNGIERSLLESIKPQVDQKGLGIGEQVATAFESQFMEIVKKQNLATGMEFLRALESSLKEHRSALLGELTDLRKSIGVWEQELKLSAERVGFAASSGYFGRKERLDDAFSDFDGKFDLLLCGRSNAWIKEAAEGVYVKVIDAVSKVKVAWQPVEDTMRSRLDAVRKYIQQTCVGLDQMADIGKRGPGNRFSLVNAAMANDLYNSRTSKEADAIVGRVRANWIQANLLTDTVSSPEAWFESAIPAAKGEVKELLKSVDFMTIMAKYFNTDEQVAELMTTLSNLSSPLFPLDPNRCSGESYTTYWIIAANKKIQTDFGSRFEKYFPVAGRNFASFHDPNEIIIYQLKYGFALHSFKGLSQYESFYKLLQKQYVEECDHRALPPIHGWFGAYDWDNLIPRRSGEESAKWFILGRAFNYLFPLPGAKSPTDKANTAFIFASERKYYLSIDDKKPVLLGGDPIKAIETLSERPDHQDFIKGKVSDLEKEVGPALIRERLEKEFIPKLEADIEASVKNPDMEEVLCDMLKELKKYIEIDLHVSTV